MYVKSKGVISDSDTGTIRSFCAMIARSAPYDAYVIVSIAVVKLFYEVYLLTIIVFDIGQGIPAPTSFHSGIGRRLSECRKWYERSTITEDA